MILLEKEYNAESLIDLEDDVRWTIESIDAPVDEHGFFEGEVHVYMEYRPLSKDVEDGYYLCEPDVFKKTYKSITNSFTTAIKLEGGTKWICNKCGGTLEDDIHYFPYCPFCGRIVNWSNNINEK